MTENLYLYSLANFRELILSILQAAQARHVVEIGSEHGAFTRDLCEYARQNGGRLTSIDPQPQPGALEFVQEHAGQPSFQFIQKTSHEALPDLAADAYIVDGDHNYYTVRRELELIAQSRAGAPWLAILHDIAWPCGRRDMYYNPGAIPPEHLRSHSHDIGITLGNPGTVEDGMRSNHIMAFAKEEGGPANGVLTAVEDFLAGRDELQFLAVPAVLGLGVIYTRNAPWSQNLAALLAPYAGNPLLERMETNRLKLLMRVIELESQLRRASAPPPTPPKPEIPLPSTPQGRRLLAHAHYVEQNWAAAGALMQELVRHFPDDFSLWLLRLECARRLNHKTHAKLIFNDAVRLHPEWADLLSSETHAAATITPGP